MNQEDLIDKISKLPPNVIAEVSDFVDFLIKKHGITTPPKLPLKFGIMKETFIMSDDFNEPLDDLMDAFLIEKRKSENSIPFDEFVKQLKAEGKLDE